MDGRAFGKLEEAFFRSGAVISVGSCKVDPKGPSRAPQIASSGPVLVGAPFNECVQLGLEHTVELGSFYSAFVIDGPDAADDYEELTIDDLDDAA